MLRAASFLCVSAALGVWGLGVAARRHAWLPAWREGAPVAAALLALGAAIQCAVVLAHGERVSESTQWSIALQAATLTWVGRVLIAQAAFTVLAALAAAMPRYGLARGAVPVAAALALGCVAGSGHVIAGGESGGLSLAAALHVLAAALWLAALPALAWAWWRARAAAALAEGATLMRRFSGVAGPMMAVLLASGLLLAEWSVARWAGLFATEYGQRLLLKLALLLGALACAMRLRAWLGRGAPLARGLPIRVLGIEWLLAAGVVVAAGAMAGLVPAAHDRIDWPFAFRLSPTGAARQRPGEVDLAWTAMLLVALGAVFGCAALVRRRRRGLGLALLGGGVLASAWLVFLAARVDAYPTTYEAAQAPYTADSIAQGARLYAQHCAACHGAQGQGNGPLAASLRKPPANLTEPHLGWHTHGDLYWWLGNGLGEGAMPGFADRTTPAERWHLINHLTALSLGHQARNLGTAPAPLDPWLAAIDFRYASRDDEVASLADWRRRSAVLLVLALDDAFGSRVRALLSAAPRLDARVVVVMPERMRAGWLDAAADAATAGDLVFDERGDIVAAWKHYRRTLANPDFRDEDPLPPGIEFLIDRFGFVRARWRADEGAGVADVDALASMIGALAREPELRSPDVHAH